jgi:hypothetical protein
MDVRSGGRLLLEDHVGTLYYGASRLALRIDDVTLAHLRVVAAAKLRRGESFAITWTDPEEPEGTRESLWIHRDADLMFKLDGPAPRLDNARLASMSAAAYVARGVEVEARRVTS